MAFLITTAWTTLLWLASATGIDPTGLLTIPGQSVDLLVSLGPYNTSWAGVTLTDGPPQQVRKAYLLQGDFRDLKLPPSEFKQVANLLRSSPEFTISARLKQDDGNVGTILSFAHGTNRFLEIQSSGRKNEIRLAYTSRVNSKVYVEAFRFRIADGMWHEVAISVSGSQAELLVDCRPQFKRLLKPGIPERNFSEPTELWLGQRNAHNYNHFKGAMFDVRLTTGPHGYLATCPHLDSTCPTCGQFFMLQSTVVDLTRHLQELSERLVAAEQRINRVEECDCQKSCQVNNSVYADGATWQIGCDICSCVHGELKCHPVECPILTCKHPVNKSGECCPRCLKGCFFFGNDYEHGVIVTAKKCVECQCDDGNMNCVTTDPETNCPKLNCPPEQQFSVPDQCCKICPDIDECKQEGGLDGHHCHQNTRCVNTPSSYVCECLPGYRRIDKFNCAELDECSTGEHNCDVNAECINTQGSYHCQCREGYTGNGYTCEPVCNQSCLNGGVCRSPDKCACPNGYTGPSCERDLDECTTNSHRCTNASVCVNMIGWYYCQCKDGYENPHVDNNLGTNCLDINECNSNRHTCHPSAQCLNTIGGFKCECPPSRRSCKLSCMFEDKEIVHGMSLSPKKDPCQICTCVRGVMKCEKPRCNCSLSGSDENPCCPQCNRKHACQHQELPGVILMHGEQWSYQCQTCECLYGEVDCWEMKCPPLLCDNPVRNSEDCCPHCEDPCFMGNTSALGQPCTFAGRMYESGSQFLDPKDPCTACNCKDGMLCCSYNYDCGDDPRPVGYDGMVAALGSAGSNSDSADAAPDYNEQYSGGIRMVNFSAGPDKSGDSHKTESQHGGRVPDG